MTARLTQAAYQCLPGGPLEVNKAFYDAVAGTADDGSRKLVESFILPIRSGKAWEVRKGDVCRITTPEGPQVRCAFNIFVYLIMVKLLLLRRWVT